MQHPEHPIEQRLAAEGVRLTRGRKYTIDALAAMTGPRTAAELHARIGDAVPLSSLYRSLAVLTEAGVLSSQHGSDGIVRFELAEWITGHHHHLICVSCGAVVDITPTDAQEHAMTQLMEVMATEAGFSVTGHRFEIEGTCPTCQ